MLYKAIILPVAKLDIKEAANWYNLKQQVLGKRFTLQIRQKIDFLRRNPGASAVRYDEVKTSVLDIFPFMIHYSIDEIEKHIIIAAVLHTSRNPMIWKKSRETPDDFEL